MEKLLLVVKNGHAADILRRALHGARALESIDVFPVGAALVGRRYDQAVVLSLPDESESVAERDHVSAWVNHIETKLPAGVTLGRAD